jgi:hypothetical protein
MVVHQGCWIGFLLLYQTIQTRSDCLLVPQVGNSCKNTTCLGREMQFSMQLLGIDCTRVSKQSPSHLMPSPICSTIAE